MERLTERISSVIDGTSGVWVKNHDYISAAVKLAEYEDLDERLNKVYGDCDGLLLRVVEMLEKHPCIDMANNTLKSRLLTDEDVDKWEEYKQLEEQGRLVKLPCKEAYTQSGDIVYLIYDDEVVECTHCGLGINPVDGKAYIMLATDEDIFPYRRPVPEYDLDPTDWCTNTNDVEVGEIGKTVFLTKSEAEAKLKELRGNND